ncbi:hypothetical protein EVAR_93439_1 [Eumeta japonica]|uniref:Uncharacterized protein n=1 Tax=Eumeta variegata TaxID=151549 RepID=A0A4C1TLT4_EUMVA|nr:hypothetical protein EVAR_93439_1 [Eumeta japonica]
MEVHNALFRRPRKAKSAQMSCESTGFGCYAATLKIKSRIVVIWAVWGRRRMSLKHSHFELMLQDHLEFAGYPTPPPNVLGPIGMVSTNILERNKLAAARGFARGHNNKFLHLAYRPIVLSIMIPIAIPCFPSKAKKQDLHTLIVY